MVGVISLSEVLNSNCLFSWKTDCPVGSIILQWGFILVTIFWTIVGIKGIIDWKQVEVSGGVSYNGAALFSVFLKFFMMYMGIIYGSSNPLLFLLFWFQIVQNVVNCFILHSLVQQFHKTKSCLGSVARAFYMYQMFSLTFQITYALAIYDTFLPKRGNQPYERLNCDPSRNIYPKEFFWLYMSDWNCGVVNLILYFFYDKDMKLDCGSARAERELTHLQTFVAYQFDVHGMRQVDKHTPEVVTICQQVRDMIFAQIKNHAFFTIGFAICELTLYFLGHYPI